MVGLGKSAKIHKNETMKKNIVEHPLVGESLSVIRDLHTGAKAFREALTRVSSHLIYESLRKQPVIEFDVETPMAKTKGIQLKTVPLLVPVLRAGLGMLDAALTLLPDAQVGFVGMARDEATLRPQLYADKLPKDMSGRTVLVLDPMLATGGSLISTLEVLTERGAETLHAVCVLASQEGMDKLGESKLVESLTVAAVDPDLNEHGFIVPGLGDAGDRQYGLHPS